MKTLVLGGLAAAAMIAVAPAIAQTAAPAPTEPQAHAGKRMMSSKVHSRAEVEAKVRDHFARIDTNRDGFITREEANAAREAMRSRMQQRMAQRRAQGGANQADLFDRLDTNRDGVVTRAEFDAVRQQRMAQRQARGGDRMAKRAGGHRMGMGFTGQMFERADADRDGRVSLQEAVNAALQRFDAADLNRDGQVTRDERIQLRQRMMQERRPG